MSPLRGENPQNRPLSKLNNQHFALRAMLPVNKMALSRYAKDITDACIAAGHKCIPRTGFAVIIIFVHLDGLSMWNHSGRSLFSGMQCGKIVVVPETGLLLIV